jgi:MFS family permease
MVLSHPTDPPAEPDMTANGQPDDYPPPIQPVGKALGIVFLVVFIDLLGFGIVLPLLPRYAQDFRPEGMSDFATGVMVGVLMSSFSLMQFIFSPIWGRISDRVGRRPILLLGLGGSVVFYALFGVASGMTGPDEKTLGLILMFVSRVGAGIAGATIATAQAVIADCTTPERRSRGMALIGAAFGIGFTFGPLIAYFGESLFADNRGGPGYLAAAVRHRLHVRPADRVLRREPVRR